MGHTTFFDTGSMDKQVCLMKKEYINQSVQHLVSEHETNDPYRLARQMGIEVDEYPFRRIRGMMLNIAGQVTVILNANLAGWLKRVVLAHELGHLILSPNGGKGYFWISEHTFMESKVEYEAHRFAVELLAWGEVPEEDEGVEQFAARVGVPVEMVRYRVFG